jgi:anaerobic selenocysteine-containing dehydrogenase
MRNLDLCVNIATKPNRSHLLTGKETLLLPCLGRTERDVQASGEQAVTVEDTVSMVHASRGRLNPPSDEVRSEPWIVAHMAKAVLRDRYGIDWTAFADDYDRIRDAIEQVIPGFDDYNERIRRPGGFRLPVATAERQWKTKSGKADFKVFEGLAEPEDVDAEALTLTTVRSHDQFNTTIYGHDDRYRGVFGRRDVVFMNTADMAARGLATGDHVDVESLSSGEVLKDFAVFAHDIARGCTAAYYPEANVLIPLSAHDKKSGTPAYKSVPVRIRRSAAHG